MRGEQPGELERPTLVSRPVTPEGNCAYTDFCTEGVDEKHADQSESIRILTEENRMLRGQLRVARVRLMEEKQKTAGCGRDRPVKTHQSVVDGKPVTVVDEDITPRALEERFPCLKREAEAIEVIRTLVSMVKPLRDCFMLIEHRKNGPDTVSPGIVPPETSYSPERAREFFARPMPEWIKEKLG